VGALSLDACTTAANNTAVGQTALSAATTGGGNTGIGQAAGLAVTTGTNNTAVGHQALKATTTATDNVSIGVNSLLVNTEGGNNVAIGRNALDANTTASDNVAVGRDALSATTTGSSTTALGFEAGADNTTGANNLFLGHDAGRSGSPGGAITTASNEICLGDENIGAANIQVDWTVASDQRDKTDFTALDLGLDFVKALAPVTYKWDKRSKYGDNTADDYDLNNITHDGTHKEDWLDIGFKAQEVQALEEAAGYTTAAKKNLTVSTSEDGKQMGLQYSKFVPILVKALQELSAKNDALEARLTTLEG